MIKIIKSNRKTISLRIIDSWEIILKAPLFVSNSFINDFLEKHNDWINKKQEQISIKNNNSTKINFLEWEKIPLLWERYSLIFDKNQKNKLIFDWRNFILNPKYVEKAKDLFIEFYKRQSKIYFEEKVAFFAKKYNLEYREIKISSAKWKWWSCNSKKNLSFVYNLILAEEKIIEYVIIHELAHTKQMNHSKFFWNEVKSMMNDYEEHKCWLKKHWNSLRF